MTDWKNDSRPLFHMAAFSLPPLSAKATPAASRRARFEATGVISETVFRAPDPRLAGIVAGEYQGWRESSQGVVRRREVPICEIPLIINFGSSFGFVDPARPEAGPRTLDTFVAGMIDSFVIVESSGEACCIQVNFTPIGARLFFQLPLSELSNRTVGLDELYGDQAARVVGALAEAGDWERRFDLLEVLIARRIGSAKPQRAEIMSAWQLMQDTNGTLDIGGLAQDVGWSHKHLIAQFRDHLGAPPKLLGRVLRLQRAIKLIGQSNQPRWVELAFDCGYFDQSHLIREFRQLAGCTPEEYLGLQLPYGGVSANSDPCPGNSSPR
jgi:AraC-like DNA-binding protein